MSERSWRPWVALAGLFVLSAGLIAYAMAPASLLPLVMSTYGIDKPTASLSISAIFLTWAVLQLPAGYFLDRYDTRWLVAGSGVVLVGAAVVGVLVESYWAFLATRLVGGATGVFIVVGSVAILGEILPEDRRATGLSLFVASPPLGVALAQIGGPPLVTAFGLEVPLVAYALVGALGIAPAILAVGRPIRAAEIATARDVIRALRHRSILLISVASFCTYAVWTFLNTWMPTYGNEVLGIQLGAAGVAAALVPLAGMVSRPLGGWFADRIGGRLRPVLAVSFASSLVFLVALNGVGTPTMFAVVLALSGGAVNLGVGLYLVYVHAVAAEATQGTSLALLLTFSQTGNLIAPAVGGWLIAQLSWTAGFAFAGLMMLLGLGIVLATPAAHGAG